jgi:hypothetical protein
MNSTVTLFIPPRVWYQGGASFSIVCTTYTQNTEVYYPLADQSLTTNSKVMYSMNTHYKVTEVDSLALTSTLIINYPGEVDTGSNALNSGDCIIYNVLTAVNASSVTAASFDIFGTFDAPATITTITSKNSNNYAWYLRTSGTFTNNSGEVRFIGTGAVQYIIRGGGSFFNFTIDLTLAATYTFYNGDTIAIAGTLTMKGRSGQVLTLQSDIADHWLLNASGAIAVDWVAVSYSDASGGSTIIATNTVDNGNNINWSIPAPSGNIDKYMFTNFSTIGKINGVNISSIGKINGVDV